MRQLGKIMPKITPRRYRVQQINSVRAGSRRYFKLESPNLTDAK